MVVLVVPRSTAWLFFDTRCSCLSRLLTLVKSVCFIELCVVFVANKMLVWLTTLFLFKVSNVLDGSPFAEDDNKQSAADPPRRGSL